jgi:glycosyltransferase involved in cell wall biosynthesis
MTGSPTVSVVIPAYNGSRFIGEALDSIYAQDLPPLEIIVVDDASRDGTPELVEDLSKRSPVPFRLIRLSENSGGPARPMNVGIEAARGDLIAVCDQDDVLLPSKLREQAAALAGDEGLSLAFSLTGSYDDRERILQDPASLLALREVSGGANFTRIAGDRLLRLLVRHGCFPLGYPGFLFRRRDWARKGGLDESLRIASDYDLVCWLSTVGDVGFIDSIHYFRRVHENNMCNNKMLMISEMRVVKRRSLVANRHLLGDRDFSTILRGEFREYAYWLRETGRYRDSLRCSVDSLRIWGCDLEAISSIAKLPIHRVHRMLSGGEPVYCGLTGGDGAARTPVERNG